MYVCMYVCMYTYQFYPIKVLLLLQAKQLRPGFAIAAVSKAKTIDE